MEITDTDFVISINNSAAFYSHENVDFVYLPPVSEDFYITASISILGGIAGYVAMIIAHPYPNNGALGAVSTLGTVLGFVIGKNTFYKSQKIDISGTQLWLTALIVLLGTLTYTLYGGLRASIFTDNIQMIVITILLLTSGIYLLSYTGSEFSLSFINKKNPHLLSFEYLPNYTAGITFFVAVAATNLFHQGNWQRVYAAKNNNILVKSLLISFFVIIPIVFFMGFCGLVAISVDPNVVPDLGFFSLLFKDKTEFLSLIIIILGLSLTISTVDTLVNAVSSLVVVDGKATFNIKSKVDFLKLSKYFIIVLSIIAFFIASKGYSVLYLFLLADLFFLFS